jgi:ribosomal protein L11 methyltransferase
MRLRLPPDASDALGSLCVELGAPGVVTSLRDLRRASAVSIPRTTSFEAYFPPELARRKLTPALERAVEAVAKEFPGVQRRSLRIEAFPLPDYGSMFREQFPPLHVGRRLLITPSWHEPSANGRAILRIDPGQAFGTGHHPTTRGCLLAIEELAAKKEGVLARGLDVGCGTGILALAMRALGVAAVVAVDNDPLAREATRHAARENEIDAVRVGTSLASVRGRFDLIVANLYSRLLAELAEQLATRLDPEGSLVVSGLLLDQEKSVRTALRRAGLAVRSRRCLSTWVTLVASPHPARPARSAPRTARR